MEGIEEFWTLNGGRKTLFSYYTEDGEFLLEQFKEHVNWMNNLPIYIEYPDVKMKDGRHLVVSHSIINKVWKHLASEDKQKKNNGKKKDRYKFKTEG